VGVTTGGEAVAWYEAGATSMLHYAFITTTPQLNIALTPSNSGISAGRPGNVLVESMQAIVYATGPTGSPTLMFTLVEPTTGVHTTPSPLLVALTPSLAWNGALLALVANPGPFFLPLSATGQPTDSPLLLSIAMASGDQPAIVALPGGNFAVAWSEDDSVTASVHLATSIQPQ
jgi:hypothetical protein